MKKKLSVALVLLMLASAGLALSEDQIESASPVAAAPQEKIEPATQWVWGEVTNVDAQAKTLTLKYLDYETDQEKELALAVDETTSYENIKSLEDIQPKDNLSVDYILKEGKNVAQGISLEKPESVPPEDNAAVVPAAEAPAPQPNQ